MTGAAIINSDRISVAPKAGLRAAAAVPPVAAAPFSLPTLQGVASAPAAASSNVAAFSSRVSIKNAIAFLVAAASEIISNSTSSVGA